MDHLEEKFELTYLIRPNSKREHAEKDDSVCIWDCAFEPTIEGQDGIYTSFFLSLKIPTTILKNKIKFMSLNYHNNIKLFLKFDMTYNYYNK